MPRLRRGERGQEVAEGKERETATDRPPGKGGGEGEGVSEGDRAVFSLGLAATSGTNVSARPSDRDGVGERPRAAASGASALHDGARGREEDGEER